MNQITNPVTPLSSTMSNTEVHKCNRSRNEMSDANLDNNDARMLLTSNAMTKASICSMLKLQIGQCKLQLERSGYATTILCRLEWTIDSA